MDDFMMWIPPDGRLLVSMLMVMLIAALIAVVAWRSGKRRGYKDAYAEWDWKFKHSPQIITEKLRQEYELTIERWTGRAEAYREELRKYVPIFNATSLSLSKISSQVAEEVVDWK